MTNNPLITAARRAAKQHARETGASYQSMLDEMAQRAGRVSWESFLADPAPLPDGDAPPTTEAKAAGPSSTLDVGPVERSAEPPVSVFRRPRMRLAVLLGVLAMGGLTAMSTPTVGVTDAISLDYERRGIATLRLPTLHDNGGRNVYVAAWRRPGDHRDALVTTIDNRPLHAWSSRLGRIRLWTAMKLSSAPVNAYLHAAYPVIRVRYDVDCRRRTWMLTDVQAADDFTSPAAYSFKEHGSRAAQTSPRVLAEPEAAALCSPDVLERTRRIVERRF